MPGPLDSKIYVGDLASNASKQELEDIFSYYGRLRNVWVARNPPGFAFVEFEDGRDAEDAVRGLDGKSICGRRARIEMSSGKSRSRFRGPPQRQGRPYNPADKCYQCGERGHYARDCPGGGGGGGGRGGGGGGRGGGGGGGGGGGFGGNRFSRRSRSRSRSPRKRSYSRSKSRDRSRSRSRGAARSYSRDRSRSVSRGRSPSREKSPASRGRTRSRSKSRGRERSRDGSEH